MQVRGTSTKQVTPDSAAKTNRCHKCREYKSMAASKTNMGCKPNQLYMKPRGYIDPASVAKNTWNDAIWSLVP